MPVPLHASVSKPEYFAIDSELRYGMAMQSRTAHEVFPSTSPVQTLNGVDLSPYFLLNT